MTDLRFRRSLDASHPVNLTFGQPLGPVQDAAGRLEITLPGFAPSFAAKLEYDNAVSRSDVIGANAGWQHTVPQPGAIVTAQHSAAQPVQVARPLPWRRGAARVSTIRAAVWRATRPVPALARPRWHSANAIGPKSLAGHWTPGRKTPLAACGSWRPSLELAPAGAISPWQVAIIIRPTPRRMRWGAGDPMPVQIITSASLAKPMPAGPTRLPWQLAAPLQPGRSSWVVPPGPEPWRCYTPPAGGAVHLLFDDRAGARGLDILFSCGAGPGPGQLVIPVLRYYIVINTAVLRRVSNNLPLPASAISISIDSTSVHWTWSASLPLAALGDLERDAPGRPVELSAEINGVEWRLLVESYDEDEQFGSSALRIGGRGIAAELSDPVYPVVQHDNVASAMTAQQLADQALTINGVPLGWALDWQAPDWLVPAGAWLFSGTPLAAVARLAEAAGAYVQPAPAARTLRVLPRYPVKPWEWPSAPAGAVLPAAATLQRGASHIDKPDYNVVIVRGLAGGIGARVKRAGTAGDRAAQMIVDPLITHVDAAAGRALAVLGDTGPKVVTRIDTGVLDSVGVIPVGTLLDWQRDGVSRKGLVRGLSVSASGSRGREPLIVRQQLEVEFNG